VNNHLMRAPSALRPCSQRDGFGGELLVAFDAPIDASGCQDADLDLDHVQPAGMLGDEVEL
jgi:hypothetical protein